MVGRQSKPQWSGFRSSFRSIKCWDSLNFQGLNPQPPLRSHFLAIFNQPPSPVEHLLCLHRSTPIHGWHVQFTSVQFSSAAQLCPTLCDPMNCSTPGLPVQHQLLRLTSIESVMPFRHLILGCSLLLLPSIPPSIRVFSNESTLHMRWPKYWSFNFSISPSNEHPGLISFRMDLLDLVAVQGTLESLL